MKTQSELQISTERATMTGATQPAPGDATRSLEIIQVGQLRGAWSNKSLPQVGDRVKVTMNGLGFGTIQCFFQEACYIGVKVSLENRPEWHRKQNPGRDFCLVYGAEIACIAPNGELAESTTTRTTAAEHNAFPKGRWTA